MNKIAVKIKRNNVAKVLAPWLDHNKQIFNNPKYIPWDLLAILKLNAEDSVFLVNLLNLKYSTSLFNSKI